MLMEYCERLSNCPFYNRKLKSLPALAEGFKRMYCFKTTPRCARFILFNTLGAEKVPFDLFPNDFDKAEMIIEEEKVKH